VSVLLITFAQLTDFHVASYENYLSTVCFTINNINMAAVETSLMGSTLVLLNSPQIFCGNRLAENHASFVKVMCL